MVDIYITDQKTRNLNKIEKPVKGCWINMVSPTDNEIRKISRSVRIKEHLLRYPLDIAEKAHIDIEDESILIVVDSPATEMNEGEKIYTTMPLGMIIVRDEILITISQVRINSVYKVLSENKFDVETDKKSRFIFQILYGIAQDYIRYLTYINKDLDKFENKMLKSMSNKELLKMMTFEKTMVYFNASVKGNQVVLEKLNKGKVLPLYDEDEDILEDTLIENRQAIEMIQTYSEILNGIVEMFGTVVSNNLNTVMKWLTSITLVISVPTMIASFLGMNVDFPFNTSTIGFYGIIIISILVTVVITFILRKRDLL